MKEKRFLKFLKERAAVLTLCGCVIVAGVMVTMYTAGLNQDKEEKLIDLNNQLNTAQIEDSTEPLWEANNDMDYLEDEVQTTTVNPQASDSTEPEAQDENSAKEQEPAESTTAPVVDFQAEDKLLSPVKGEVILPYSMDQTVYFTTLAQYKYCPAMIISAELNQEVAAAAKGIVKDIFQNEETGLTVTMDLGNGYEILYGQLKEVPLQVGDIVEAGDLVGNVSEPTKYYSMEGNNLYLEMRKNGESINPQDYLDQK